MALCETSQEAIYLKRVLSDLCGYADETPTLIYGDNQGSLDLVRNPVKHNKSKHIAIKYHFIRNLYVDNSIELCHVRSDDNIADIMTKPLPKCKLDKFCGPMFGCDPVQISTELLIQVCWCYCCTVRTFLLFTTLTAEFKRGC